MQYGILAYLTARASMFPFFGWEWDEGRSQRAKHTTSCTFTDVPHRTNTGRVSNCWQYIFYRPSGYHLFTSFIHFPIISLASELGGEVKKTRKGNKQHGLRKNHRPRRRARRHMSGNKIPNASVSLRLCESASLPSVVYCLRTLLPFRLCTMYTNKHT